MQTSQSFIAKLIRGSASRLHAPPGVDPAKLLWGLAGNESGFGADFNPRHEDAYCANVGGRYATAIKNLSEAWGCWAHCSYGPWQIMFCNTVGGVSPMQLSGDLEIALWQTIQFLNSYIFMHLGATTLEQIACAYNRGHLPQAGEALGAYVEEFLKNYAAPMPQ